MAKIPELTKAQLREAAVKHHESIMRDLPKGVGYFSFLYNPSTGNIVFTSSMDRRLCLDMVRNWLIIQEREHGKQSAIITSPKVV